MVSVPLCIIRTSAIGFLISCGATFISDKETDTEIMDAGMSAAEASPAEVITFHLQIILHASWSFPPGGEIGPSPFMEDMPLQTFHRPISLVSHSRIPNIPSPVHSPFVIQLGPMAALVRPNRPKVPFAVGSRREFCTSSRYLGRCRYSPLSTHPSARLQLVVFGNSFLRGLLTTHCLRLSGLPRLDFCPIRSLLHAILERVTDNQWVQKRLRRVMAASDMTKRTKMVAIIGRVMTTMTKNGTPVVTTKIIRRTAARTKPSRTIASTARMA
ncbi:hypothetical protein V8F20_012057 [Naviculisporaceae sp. PSN 640]